MKIKVVIVIIFFFLGCKKDKLKGDSAILIGKWKWVETRIEQSGTITGTFFINPSTEGKNFSIDFLKKGCIVYYENGSKTYRKRLVLNEFSSRSNQIYFFEIYPDNKTDDFLNGFLYDRVMDTLEIQSGYPYVNTNEDGTAKAYFNYFVRE